MNWSAVRVACALFAGLLVMAGVAGMVLSFLFMASVSMADITAGAAGFVAGSVFVAGGLISLSLLSSIAARDPGSPGA